MYIVMKDALNNEIIRKQIFHDQSVKEVLLEMVQAWGVVPGDKIEIVKNDD